MIHDQLSFSILWRFHLHFGSEVLSMTFDLMVPTSVRLMFVESKKVCIKQLKHGQTVIITLPFSVVVLLTPSLNQSDEH